MLAYFTYSFQRVDVSNHRHDTECDSVYEQAALKERDLPPDLHKRVLAYFNYSFQRVGGETEDEIWQELPHELRVRTALSQTSLSALIRILDLWLHARAGLSQLQLPARGRRDRGRDLAAAPS